MVFHEDVAPNLYALLIGIDYYLPNRLPDGSYYPSLAGCVRDITLVEEFLRNKLGVPEEYILTSGVVPTDCNIFWQSGIHKKNNLKFN